eukprot:354140-Chlamydomonas_euryale.AAC.2
MPTVILLHPQTTVLNSRTQSYCMSHPWLPKCLAQPTTRTLPQTLPQVHPGQVEWSRWHAPSYADVPPVARAIPDCLAARQEHAQGQRPRGSCD